MCKDKIDRRLVERVTALAEAGRPDRASQVCRETPGIFSSIVLPGLELAEKGELIAKEAVEALTDLGLLK